MPIIRSMLTDRFTIKKMTDSTSSGKLTRTLSTVSAGNRGRFMQTSGTENVGFFGSVEAVTKRLFCDYNSAIIFGVVVVDDGTSDEYDVLRVNVLKDKLGKHHMEIGMKERRRDIA